jgi:hypothetical protein
MEVDEDRLAVRWRDAYVELNKEEENGPDIERLEDKLDIRLAGLL